MNAKPVSWMRRHPVASYYLLALLFTWAVEFPLVAVRQGWTDAQIPFAIHYLAAFGPALAALIVTAVTAGRAGLAELWGRITRWRVGWTWLLVALSPLAIFAAALPVVQLLTGAWPDLWLLGQVSYLPYLGIGVLPLWLVTYGFGEEIGWRGFALPRLQRTRTAASATLLLGCMWMVWHLPAFFYLETYETLGLVVLPGFLVGVLCGAVVFTWLYNSTGGSVLIVAIWHALYDVVTASKAGQDIIPIVTSALVIAAGLIIPRVFGLENFARGVRHAV